MYNTYRVVITIDDWYQEEYGFNSIIDPRAKIEALELFGKKVKEMETSNISMVEYYMNKELIMCA